jgi:Scramblase
MRVNEVATEAELVTVERPCACAATSCKCCCYQSARFTSGGNVLGTVKETCYFCVPSFKILDASGAEVYLLHPPTCCGGVCVNCFTEGNPCGKGCCKVPFWIFDAAAQNTNGSNAPQLGKILKKPKSLAVEIFTDANAFEVHFPATSTVEQKAALVGTAIFLNAVFFESGSAE